MAGWRVKRTRGRPAKARRRRTRVSWLEGGERGSYRSGERINGLPHAFTGVRSFLRGAVGFAWAWPRDRRYRKRRR